MVIIIYETVLWICECCGSGVRVRGARDIYIIFCYDTDKILCRYGFIWRTRFGKKLKNFLGLLSTVSIITK